MLLNMKKIKSWLWQTYDFLAKHGPGILIAVLAVLLMFSLLLRDITNLPGGLSSAEKVVALTPIGWQGLIQDPFFLITKLIQSAGYVIFGQGGVLVSRMPSVLLGAVAITSFVLVIRAWHGKQIAVMAAVLFATSAWVLHVSRYASYDSTYLAAIPLLIASQVLIRNRSRLPVAYLVLGVWSVLIFVPGMIWFVLVALYWQWPDLQATWQDAKHWWQRVLLAVIGLSWLPLMAYHSIGSLDALLTWLGLPADFGTISEFGTRLAMVPVNLFVFGPANPELWLGRLPILDVITLGLAIIGIWYYARRWRAARTQLLAIYFTLAVLVIGLGGAAQLSLIVPIGYFLAVAGAAYMLKVWFKRFPNNPVARNFGIVLISSVIAISSLYNLRSYFVAWPNNQQTISRFGQR